MTCTSLSAPDLIRNSVSGARLQPLGQFRMADISTAIVLAGSPFLSSFSFALFLSKFNVKCMLLSSHMLVRRAWTKYESKDMPLYLKL